MDLPPEDGEPPRQELDAPRRPKRQKIANACEACRGRKIRCDGERPICGACRRANRQQHSCVYTKVALLDATGPYVTSQALIDRIQSLERVIAASQLAGSQNGCRQVSLNASGLESESESLDNRQAAPSPASNLPERAKSPIRALPAAAPDLDSPGRSIQFISDKIPDTESCGPSNSSSRLNQRALGLGHAEDGTSPVNAMGSTTYIDSPGASPLNVANQFYGGSSAAHFMQQLKETISGTGHVQNHSIELSQKSLPSKANHLEAFGSDGSTVPLGNLSLPQRDLADSLLETYWNRSHTLYPFVHKPSFTRAYQDLWKPAHQLQGGLQGDFGLGTPGVSDSRTIVFHCALNAIFALSCQLSETAMSREDRESMSQTYFLRSKSLLHVDILDHGSIALVQTLLIIAQFLQSTSFPSRCWTSLGLACRIGQGLGLHVEDSDSRRDPQEVELRRRVWYGCTIMDIVASTTLGRPPMTPCRITIPMPSATTENDFLDLNQSISPLNFYLETIKLYLILGKILLTVYKASSVQVVSNNHERGNKSSYIESTDSEAIFALDEELSNFEDGITSYLHWERGNGTRNSMPQSLQRVSVRQTNVLHARYLHTRVLLYRPTFLRFCKKVRLAPLSHQPQASKDQNMVANYHFQQEGNLRSKMEIQSSAACVSAAVDLVTVLSDATTKAADGAWWYTTFYLCTAAMIIMLAESCFKSHGTLHVDINGIRTAWDRCCETLRKLIKRGHPVELTLNGLCNIHRKLVLEPATKPQNLSPEAASNVREAQQAGDGEAAQDETGAGFGLGGVFPECMESNLQGSTVPEEAYALPMEPVMDFMMQDLNFMPFGVLDESWWRLQYGDRMANGGM